VTITSDAETCSPRTEEQSATVGTTHGVTIAVFVPDLIRTTYSSSITVLSYDLVKTRHSSLKQSAHDLAGRKRCRSLPIKVPITVQMLANTGLFLGAAVVAKSASCPPI